MLIALYHFLLPPCLFVRFLKEGECEVPSGVFALLERPGSPLHQAFPPIETENFHNSSPLSLDFIPYLLMPWDSQRL